MSDKETENVSGWRAGCALVMWMGLTVSPLPVGSISVMSRKTAFDKEIYTKADMGWMVTSDLIKWGLYAWLGLQFMEGTTVDINANTVAIAAGAIIVASQLALMYAKAITRDGD